MDKQDSDPGGSIRTCVLSFFIIQEAVCTIEIVNYSNKILEKSKILPNKIISYRTSKSLGGHLNTSFPLQIH